MLQSNKLSILMGFCDQYGMKINENKTKCFVIDGNDDDKQSRRVEEIVVDTCSKYTYLGSVFTSAGSVSAKINAHADSKMCQILKYVSFIKKNNNIPFYLKRKVFHAALMPYCMAVSPGLWVTSSLLLWGM